MTNETINAINSTNPFDLFVAANNDTNTLLLSSILVLIYLVLLFATTRTNGIKNALLVSSIVITVISGLFLLLDAVKVYFFTLFLILTIASLLIRVITGE